MTELNVSNLYLKFVNLLIIRPISSSQLHSNISAFSEFFEKVDIMVLLG